MNPVKKAYCRVFQGGFRAALPALPYRKPEILHHVEDIPGVLAEHGCVGALLVTDSGIRKLGLTLPLEEALRSSGVNCAVFETIANPTTDVIEQAVALYHDEGCQALIGFGGGSSIDTAKAVGARIANPNKSLSQMGGILKVHRALPPLIAIPTTAGTGSETTLASVVIDSDTRHKYAINDFPLIPHYAVLDPETTRSLPPSITATTGMDALTHAVEAYIGRSTTAETRREARSASRLIFRYLKRAYDDGDDMIARKQMLLASFLAGDAFSKSYVGYVHAVAHSIGGKYDTPHGLANAVLLPHVLRAYGDAAALKLRELAVATGVASRRDGNGVAAIKFIDAICEMNRSMGIPDTLPEVQREDVPEMARRADAEANPLYPVPVVWDARELERFYYAVMEQPAGQAKPASVQDAGETDKEGASAESTSGENATTAGADTAAGSKIDLPSNRDNAQPGDSATNQPTHDEEA